jgi:hypothetical protein
MVTAGAQFQDVLVVLMVVSLRLLNHVLELRRIHLRISIEKDYLLLIFRLCVTVLKGSRLDLQFVLDQLMTLPLSLLHRWLKF